MSVFITEIEDKGTSGIKYVPVKDLVCHFVQGINTILTKAINDDVIQRSILELFYKEKFDKSSRKAAILRCDNKNQWQLVCNLVQGAKEKYPDVGISQEIDNEGHQNSDLLTLSASLEDMNAFDDDNNAEASTSEGFLMGKPKFPNRKRKFSSNRFVKRNKSLNRRTEESVRYRLGPSRRIIRSSPTVEHYGAQEHSDLQHEVFDEWRPQPQHGFDGDDGFPRQDIKRFRRQRFDEFSYY